MNGRADDSPQDPARVAPWSPPVRPRRPQPPHAPDGPEVGQLWRTASRFENDDVGYSGLMNLLVLIVATHVEHGCRWFRAAPVDPDVAWALDDDVVLTAADSTDGGPLRVRLGQALDLAAGQLGRPVAALTDSGREVLQDPAGRRGAYAPDPEDRRRRADPDVDTTWAVLATVQTAAATRRAVDPAALLIDAPWLGEAWVIEPATTPVTTEGRRSALDVLLKRRARGEFRGAGWRDAVGAWWDGVQSGVGGAALTPATGRKGGAPQPARILAFTSAEDGGPSARLVQRDGRWLLRLAALADAFEGRRVLVLLPDLEALEGLDWDEAPGLARAAHPVHDFAVELDLGAITGDLPARPEEVGRLLVWSED